MFTPIDTLGVFVIQWKVWLLRGGHRLAPKLYPSKCFLSIGVSTNMLRCALCHNQGFGGFDMRDFEFWKPHLQRAHADAWRTLRAHFPGIGVMPPAKWNNRLTKTAGRAHGDWKGEAAFVELSTKIFRVWPEGFILEIIPHELAHVAAMRRFDDWGHGKGWKACMGALNMLEPGAVYWSEQKMLAHRKNFWKMLDTAA